MKPIVIPELEVASERFPLNSEKWKSWQEDLTQLGIEIIVESRQYLEDCTRGTTDLIAEEGLLVFEHKKYHFTAQLDCAGCALYVDLCQDSGGILTKLIREISS